MDKAQVRSRRRNKSKTYEITYEFADFEQIERQKRIDEAYDYIFDEIADDMERFNNGNEYGNRNIIR